jgi:hypothetical protein
VAQLLAGLSLAEPFQDRVRYLLLQHFAVPVDDAKDMLRTNPVRVNDILLWVLHDQHHKRKIADPGRFIGAAFTGEYKFSDKQFLAWKESLQRRVLQLPTARAESVSATSASPPIDPEPPGLLRPLQPPVGLRVDPEAQRWLTRIVPALHATDAVSKLVPNLLEQSFGFAVEGTTVVAVTTIEFLSELWNRPGVAPTVNEVVRTACDGIVTELTIRLLRPEHLQDPASS